jgi:transposase-like protein
MKMKKKPHSAEFKFKVAIEAIRGEKTTSELCQEFGVVSSQIFKWKKMVLDSGASVFGQQKSAGAESQEIEKLHATIGRLKVENDFLEHVLRRSR